MAVQASSDQVLTIRMIDVASGTALGTLRIEGAALPEPNPMALSVDGRYIATADAAGQVHVARTANGDEARPIILDGTGPVAVAFTPDGDVVALRALEAAGSSWTISKWGVDGSLRQGPTEVAGATNIAAAHVTADGEFLLVTTQEGVSIVSLERLEVLGNLRGPGFTGFEIIEAGPDRVLIPSPDTGGAQLWDLSTRLPVGAPLLAPGSAAHVVIPEDDVPVLYGFSTHGTTLFMTHTALDPEELVEELCERVGRNLTPEEWRQSFPNYVVQGDMRVVRLMTPTRPRQSPTDLVR